MIRPLKLVELLVILCAIAGIVPLYPHLELLPKLLLPVAALSGIIAAHKGVKLPTVLLTVLSIALFVYYSTRINHNNIILPASSLLASLLAVRLAGERTSRSFLQICALSIFCL